MVSRSVMSRSILQRVASGEMAAMQECIDLYGGLVWSLARRLSPSPTDAEDAVQEIFIALWEHADRFDARKGEEVTFVSTIARRRLIDRLRKHQRDRRVVTEAEEQARGLEPTRRPEDRDELARNDEVDRAAEAIEQLTPDQRRCLHLSVHFGLTHQVIAEQTGLPLGTVKTHIRRGLQRVRALLAAEGDEAVGVSS